MSLGILTNKTYFFFRGDKEKNSSELYITANFRSLIDFALRDRYYQEYSGGSPTPTYTGEFPIKRFLVESPYNAYIAGTEDPDKPQLSEWEKRFRKGCLVCFACGKDYLFRGPGETMCLSCTAQNEEALKRAAELEMARQKQRAQKT